MQKVSQEWKDNQNELLVPESEIELSMRITDPDAYEDASASDNGNMYFAQTDDIVSGVDYVMRPTLTLEQNLWVLDGSGEVLDTDNYGTNRYISNISCGLDKIFTTRPVITISFSKVFTELLQGVTIVWSKLWEEYAEEFIVTAYNGETVVATKTVTDNTSIKSIVYMDIIDYDSITIEIVRWSLSNRRARVEEVVIGIDKSYTKEDLFSYSHSQSVNPLSTELPKVEVSFSIDNVDNSYNPHNPQGLSKYLIERQEITVKYGYKINDKIEWIDGGRFYLSEWDAPQDGMTAEFKASDLLEFMRKTYYGGTYYPNGRSLYDLAVDVLTDAELPLNKDGSVKWKIDDSLKNIYTVAPLPIDTHANSIQLIANAGGCVIFQDRVGVLRIEPIVSNSSNMTNTDYSINYFNSYSKSNISLSKPIKDVAIGFYQYSVANDSTELYKGDANIVGTRELIITYSGSATNVNATVSGGTLNSATYYTNACKLTITASGKVTVTVTGKLLESAKTEISIYNNDSGETVSVDNVLITSLDRASVIGEWIRSYYNNRMTLSSSWRADPRLDALDIVDNENDYGTSKVLMTDVTYDYNGAFKGSGEGKVI